MPRVIYPSQLFQVIDLAFPQARDQQEDPTKRLTILPESAGALGAVARLADQIAPELCHLIWNDYAQFQVAIAVITDWVLTTVANWTASGTKSPSNRPILVATEGVGPLSAITNIRRALDGLPDQATPESFERP
jgi:hypothetical protein